MMKGRLKRHGIITAGALALFLAGCQAGEKTEDRGAAGDTDNATTEQSRQEDSSAENGGMDHMMHGGTGEVPEGLKEAGSPAYPVGTKVMMHADHMPGMDGVEATVSGAYETTVYSVSYTPTDGSEPVKDHKWVIHEELENPGDAPLKPGATAVLKADHMPGMEGAEATIDSAQQTTVYMVDFVPEDSDQEVKNHKWVTEDELSAE
nr:YdhK family protein [Edaphobacillus lindanitolerans]